MSSEEKYKKYIKQLGLTDEEGENLIGALQGFAEKILAKKYGLEREDQYENGRNHTN